MPVVLLSFSMMDLESLSPEHRAWVIHSEQLWRKAHDIAARNPDVDVSGIYHVLRNLEKTPTQRLRDILGIGQALFRTHRR
jgi:hypothetical protein